MGPLPPLSQCLGPTVVPTSPTHSGVSRQPRPLQGAPHRRSPTIAPGTGTSSCGRLESEALRRGPVDPQPCLLGHPGEVAGGCGGPCSELRFPSPHCRGEPAAEASVWPNHTATRGRHVNIRGRKPHGHAPASSSAICGAGAGGLSATAVAAPVPRPSPGPQHLNRALCPWTAWSSLWLVLGVPGGTKPHESENQAGSLTQHRLKGRRERDLLPPGVPPVSVRAPCRRRAARAGDTRPGGPGPRLGRQRPSCCAAWHGRRGSGLHRPARDRRTPPLSREDAGRGVGGARTGHTELTPTLPEQTEGGRNLRSRASSHPVSCSDARGCRLWVQPVRPAWLGRGAACVPGPVTLGDTVQHGLMAAPRNLRARSGPAPGAPAPCCATAADS